MLPDRVSNPGPLTYESGALPIALRGPATYKSYSSMTVCKHYFLQTSIANTCIIVDELFQGMPLTLLHSERPKLHTILVFLSVIGLNSGSV